ncbi:MAG: hypothetical protein U0Z17_01885 [Bacteroidales bacterium]
MGPYFRILAGVILVGCSIFAGITGFGPVCRLMDEFKWRRGAAAALICSGMFPGIVFSGRFSMSTIIIGGTVSLDGFA